MDSPDESLTAVDVIRCAYLARMASVRGDEEAARRWQAKVDAWYRENGDKSLEQDDRECLL